MRATWIACLSSRPAVEMATGDDPWVAIEDGPRGGKRFRHKTTGKIAYGKKPGGGGGGKKAAAAKQPAAKKPPAKKPAAEKVEGPAAASKKAPAGRKQAAQKQPTEVAPARPAAAPAQRQAVPAEKVAASLGGTRAESWEKALASAERSADWDDQTSFHRVMEWARDISPHDMHQPEPGASNAQILLTKLANMRDHSLRFANHVEREMHQRLRNEMDSRKAGTWHGGWMGEAMSESEQKRFLQKERMKAAEARDPEHYFGQIPDYVRHHLGRLMRLMDN